ncbi:MAG: hypothetical protein L3J28_01655 [Candidatus Polarisedimenticolaceae bacterium]|nr:hypothetical protein [Candidatus Polarisedimenticolaceae bacterium]
MKRFAQWLTTKITDWLMRDAPLRVSPLCDFNHLSHELKQGDVLLIEGRSRVSEVIKMITQSSWTHAALYLGRISDIPDPEIQAKISEAYDGHPSDQLIIEALLGEGTIIAPLHKYREDHIRICRPSRLTTTDAHHIIAYTIKHLGFKYDVRQLFDLARFLFPWAILPRRWRSSLFEHNAGAPTHAVCTTLIAEAFGSVDFPVLPFIDRGLDGSIRFYRRNPRLMSPKDFDSSPYFDIIKYPFLGLDDLGIYRKLPWSSEQVLFNDDHQDFMKRNETEGTASDKSKETPQEKKSNQIDIPITESDDEAIEDEPIDDTPIIQRFRIFTRRKP